MSGSVSCGGWLLFMWWRQLDGHNCYLRVGARSWYGRRP